MTIFKKIHWSVISSIACYGILSLTFGIAILLWLTAVIYIAGNVALWMDVFK